jgi:hypothetical protein
MRMRAPSPPFHLALGLVVWSVWFVVLYGGLSLGCALAPPDPSLGAATWLNGLLAAFSALTLAWLLRQVLACWRSVRTGAGWQRFVMWVALGVYAAAAVATLVIGVPVFVLAPCA